MKGPPKELLEELPPWTRVEKRPRDNEVEPEDSNKKKKRRGKVRCRPGANERRWTALEVAQHDPQQHP